MSAEESEGDSTAPAEDPVSVGPIEEAPGKAPGELALPDAPRDEMPEESAAPEPEWLMPGSENIEGSNEWHEEEPANPLPVIPIPPVIDVTDLDWDLIGSSLRPEDIRARMSDTVERLETLLYSEALTRMLFDDHRSSSADRVIHVAEMSDEPLWFIGDIHGDLLALESALALIRREAGRESIERARIVLLGDLFDDGGYGFETVLRVFEMMLESPQSVCLIAGNHDESLGYDGERFTATVSPFDFSDFLNANSADDCIARAGRLVVRVVAGAPRALFFPDGLLVVHGGFPLTDLHAALADGMDWNDPRCLTDFVWTRAHRRARKKLPNRVSRGSQFGYEDFAAFCAVASGRGRAITHMVRGHDHVEERYEIYPAYATTPVLTTVALSRRLGRELFGPHARVPTVARWVRGSLPQVYRLHIPEKWISEFYPEEVVEDQPADDTEPAAT